MRLFLLSGPIAVGKTSVAQKLVEDEKFLKISSGRYLARKAQEARLDGSRRTLQQIGDQLDLDTDCRWLIDDVAAPVIAKSREVERWLLDSVRKARQVEHFKSSFGLSAIHIYLDAPDDFLRDRYNYRIGQGREYSGYTPYDDAIKHPNELASRALKAIANNVFNVVDKSPTELAKEIARHIGG